MLRFKRYIAVLLLVPLQHYAQTPRITGLKEQYYKAETVNAKIAALFAICNERNSLHPDTLYQYALLAKTAVQQHQNQIEQALAEYYMAFAFSKKARFDTVVTIINRQLNILQYSGTEKELYGKLAALKGVNYFRMGKQKEAVDYLLNLLAIAEKEDDLLTQLSALSNIGSVYIGMGQDKAAIEWYDKGLLRLPHPSQPQYTEYEVIMTGNKGLAWLHLYQAARKKQDGDSCEKYLRYGLQLANRQDNIFFESHLSGLLGLYLSYTTRKNEAEQYLQQGLALRKNLGDMFYIISDMSVLSSVYANTGAYAKGEAVAKEAISLCDKLQNSNLLQLMYKSLAENYKAAGDINSYSQIMLKLLQVKDSVYKVNSAQALAELQTKYELQKKENTIIQQKYELGRKNILLFTVAAILAATILLGYIFIRQRKKAQLLKWQQVEALQKERTTQAVLEAEEKERKRIAGDLHDSVAQKMVAAKMNLEALQGKIQDMPQQEKMIYNNIQTLLEDSATEVRQLSHSMMPMANNHGGLSAAIQDLLDKINTPGLHVHFIAEGNFVQLPENKALYIYRIVQEAVQNILKHAAASRMDMALIGTKEGIDITIEDDGVGFNMTDMASSNTGLKNIRSRVQYLGGTVDVQSQPGKGTALIIYIPL
ncbi:MAG TPA: sensor histidine kinase [Ferruginibacter sp.]|nr:sensor histidine kinase [Ferruginibacter sp.]HMP20591.1 sensor histidine kinase [Ferruginibacter sp.]